MMEKPISMIVLLSIQLCAIKEAYTSVEYQNLSRTTILSKSWTVCLLLTLYSILMIWWFRLNDFVYLVLLVAFSCIFSNYMKKSSKFLHLSVNPQRRKWSDKLVTTSAVYLFCSLIGIYYGYIELASLTFCTWIGSSMYHKYAESMYFNLDNIFATTQLFVYLYSLVLSYDKNIYYYYFGLFGISVAIFFLVYCGAPADINMIKSCSCIRSDRPLYNNIHTLWHLASGVGPGIAVVFFNDINAKEIPFFYSMLYFSLLLAVIINIMGNYIGIMPLD